MEIIKISIYVEKDSVAEELIERLDVLKADYFVEREWYHTVETVDVEDWVWDE